jgi:hypothetical protein
MLLRRFIKPALVPSAASHSVHAGHALSSGESLTHRLERQGSANVAFARRVGDAHGPVASTIFDPSKQPATVVAGSRVGSVIHEGQVAEIDAEALAPQDYTDELALMTTMMLIDMAHAIATAPIEKELAAAEARQDRHLVRRIKMQLKTAGRMTGIKKSSLSRPGALRDPRTRTDHLRPILKSVAAIPYLETDQINQINGLARHLGIGAEDLISEKGARRARKKSQPRHGPVTTHLSRTPLEQFAGMTWAEICALCGFDPRHYQQSWFQALLLRAQHGYDRGLLGAPYQVGKTFTSFPLALALATAMYPGKTILIIVPQKSVKQDTIDTIEAIAQRLKDRIHAGAGARELKFGIIDGDDKDFGSGYDVVVASGWTLGSTKHIDRLDPDRYGVVACDEAGFLRTATGQRIINRLGFIDDQGQITPTDQRILFGFSADAALVSFDRIFGENARLDEFDLPWYVANEWLHEPIGIQISYPATFPKDEWIVTTKNGDTVEYPKATLGAIGYLYRVVKQRCGDGKVLIFCPKIEIAELIALFFNSTEGAGIAYAHHSRGNPDLNRKAQLGFQNGTGPRVIVGVRDLAVGFSAKGAVAVVLYHQTTSLPLFGQFIGRILGIHDGEPQRQVQIIEMVRGASKRNHMTLPRLLGVPGYPANNEEYRPLQIEGQKRLPPPPLKFVVRPDADAMGLDFDHPVVGQSIVHAPRRFIARLCDVLQRTYQGDRAAMAAAVQITEDELDTFMTGQLPRLYAQVWRMANTWQNDNPARLVDAWVNDSLDLLTVVFPAEIWVEAPHVNEVLRFIRRVSLTANYHTADGARFASGLELDADQSFQLGRMIRGEIIDAAGAVLLPEWRALARLIILSGKEIVEDSADELLKSAGLEIAAEAQARRDRQKGDDTEDEDNEGDGDERADANGNSEGADTGASAVGAQEAAGLAASQTSARELELMDRRFYFGSNQGIYVWGQLLGLSPAEFRDRFPKSHVRTWIRKLLAYRGFSQLGLELSSDVSWWQPRVLRDVEYLHHILNMPIAILRDPLMLSWAEVRGAQLIGDLVSMREEDIGAGVFQTLNEQLQHVAAGLQAGMETHAWVSTPHDLSVARHHVLNLSVDELEFSTRPANILITTGVEYIGDLVQRRDELMRNPSGNPFANFGPKSRREIDDKLLEPGFRDLLDASDWLRPGVAEHVEALESSIDTLGLSEESLGLCRAARVHCAGQLAMMTEEELASLASQSEAAITEFRTSLTNIGLQLGMNTQGWQVPAYERWKQELYEELDKPCHLHGVTFWGDAVSLSDDELTAIIKAHYGRYRPEVVHKVRDYLAEHELHVGMDRLGWVSRIERDVDYFHGLLNERVAKIIGDDKPYKRKAVGVARGFGAELLGDLVTSAHYQGGGIGSAESVIVSCLDKLGLKRGMDTRGWQRPIYLEEQRLYDKIAARAVRAASVVNPADSEWHAVFDLPITAITDRRVLIIGMRAGIHVIGQLIELSADDLGITLDLELDRVNEALTQIAEGLCVGMDMQGWDLPADARRISLHGRLDYRWYEILEAKYIERLLDVAGLQFIGQWVLNTGKVKGMGLVGTATATTILTYLGLEQGMETEGWQSPGERGKAPGLDEKLNARIDMTRMSRATTDFLQTLGLVYTGELVRMTTNEFFAHGGTKNIREELIRVVFLPLRLGFGTNVYDWQPPMDTEIQALYAKLDGRAKGVVPGCYTWGSIVALSEAQLSERIRTIGVMLSSVAIQLELNGLTLGMSARGWRPRIERDRDYRHEIFDMPMTALRKNGLSVSRILGENLWSDFQVIGQLAALDGDILNPFYRGTVDKLLRDIDPSLRMGMATQDWVVPENAAAISLHGRLEVRWANATGDFAYTNILHRNNIYTLGQWVTSTGRIKGLGPKYLGLMSEVLASYGLAQGMDTLGWTESAE